MQPGGLAHAGVVYLGLYDVPTMSRRSWIRVGLQASLCLALLPGVTSLCRADGHWSGSVAATTDYVFRGISQTYGGAALQAGLDYQSSRGWFAGSWASNVSPYPFDSDAAEINVYSGFGRTLGPAWTARASYTRYLYTWDRRRKPYDYGEFAVTLEFRDRLSATISYQPDNTRFATSGYVRNRQSLAYELTGRWALPQRFALVGGVGYYDLSHLFGVSYWAGDAGVSYTYGRFEVDLTRFIADKTVRRLFEDASADGRWVATAVFRF